LSGFFEPGLWILWLWGVELLNLGVQAFPTWGELKNRNMNIYPGEKNPDRMGCFSGFGSVGRKARKCPEVTTAGILRGKPPARQKRVMTQTCHPHAGNFILNFA
jgi:hypothetical protein